MGKWSKVIGPPIEEGARKFIEEQRVFFVGSAPLSACNHVNISPKNAKHFRLVGDNVATYLDFSGSSAETAAHLFENGRLTIMFVSFDRSRIMRLYGEGQVILPQELFASKKHKAIRDAHHHLESSGNWRATYGARAIIKLNVSRVSESSGHYIPRFEFVSNPITLLDKTDMPAYRRKQNSFSIDGLKGLAQVEEQKTPVAVWEENGYLFASYGDDDPATDDNPDAERGLSKSSIFFRRIRIRLGMVYASGFASVLPKFELPKRRDAIMFLFGLAMARIVLARQIRK